MTADQEKRIRKFLIDILNEMVLTHPFGNSRAVFREVQETTTDCIETWYDNKEKDQ